MILLYQTPVAGLPVEVPLWLAITLKQRGRCRLVPLAWMDIEVLSNKKEEESQSQVNVIIVFHMKLFVSIYI